MNNCVALRLASLIGKDKDNLYNEFFSQKLKDQSEVRRPETPYKKKNTIHLFLFFQRNLYLFNILTKKTQT